MEDEMERARLAVFSILGLCLTAAGLSAGTAGESAGVFVKDRPAPALELPAIDGRSTLELGSFAGQRVIVLQFASW